MNQHPQPRETPAPILKTATASDARKLAENLMDVMSALLGVIERETELVLSQTAPELLTTLHRHHDVFRAMLQINLTVLATAHAVSESIVRGVNAEIQRRNIPNTYTAAGRRAAPGPRHMTPLAVSRSL
jgi:hypothetical protein